VLVLHNYVIHVHGLEPIEIHRKGDKINGGMFMELKEVGIIIVTLPSQRIKLSL
jgi:hypothetical protein